MIGSYNPFRRELERTEHGLINYKHNMGTVYVTHKRKEHFFKKYNGFAISKSELEAAYIRRVFWVLIIYHKDDGTTIPYKYKLEKAEFLEEYNNGKDCQKIFPLKQLEEIKIE